MSVSAKVDLSAIPRYSEEPIREIPQYVFENCNQYTCNSYVAGLLPHLKKKAGEITKEALETIFKGDQKKATIKGEEFDWIFGLDKLESEYLSRPDFSVADFNLENIIEINACFSRMCNENPGEYRARNMRWANVLEHKVGKSLDILSHMTIELIECTVTSKFGEDKLATISDPFKKVKPISVPISTLLRYLRDVFKTHKLIRYGNKNYTLKDSLPKMEKHLRKVQKQFPSMKKPGQIDVLAFIRSKVHYFPYHKEVKPRMQTCLETIQDPKMHPIEKACRIWYETIRIHISYEANKRTGKALGAIILLAHGYLPPKIAKEDTEAYVNCLYQSFEREDGIVLFTDFIVKMILKTQEEMKSSETMMSAG